MQRIDTKTVNQSVDLRELAARFTELTRASGQKELCGPCPKCGGDDRFHCQATFWFCRKCHPEHGSAVEFIMWKDNKGFKEAAAILTNAPMPTTQARRAPTPKRPTEQPQDWQRSAETIAKTAHARLFDDANQEAEQGRAYLDSRGLEPHTWQAFKLGFALAALPGTEGKQRAPAIVIPWYRGGKVCAVRYRFLQAHEYTDSDGKQRKEKQTALSGSSFAGVLYGGQAMGENIPEKSTLIICEGELNNASIWQAGQGTRVNALSIGSESATISPNGIAHAARYATLIPWLDRAERTLAVMKALGLDEGRGIQSKDGKDANDLLQAGKLGSFLAGHRFNAAKDREQQERLLWDLWDAAQSWSGVDEDTSRVMRHIAKTLGIVL